MEKHNQNILLHLNIFAQHAMSPIKLYFIISFLGIILFFVYATSYGYDAFTWIVMHHWPKARFCDYFMHLEFCVDPENLYWKEAGNAACFPPFAYIMYYFLFKISAFDGIAPKIAESADYNLFIFLYYSILSVFLLYNAVLFKSKLKQYENVLLMLSLLLSVPFFMGCIERGNATLLVLSLLIFFYKTQDCHSKIMKIIAIILLSICIGFKIYPAIFSLIYLKNKRYKELAILVITSIFVLLGPFYFFGGFDGFVCWFYKIISMMNLESYGRIEYIKGLVYTLQCMMLGNDIKILTNMSPYIFLILCVIAIFKTKNKFFELFLLCAIIVFFPSKAFRYSLCYLSIPFVCYADKIKIKKLHNYIICVMFGLLFTIPSLFMAIIGINNKIFNLNGVTYTDIYMYIIAYSFFIYIFLNCIFTRKNRSN